MKQKSLFRISALFFTVALLVLSFGIVAGALRGGDPFDNNGDGKVDISDVTATLNYLAGGEGSASVFDDNNDGKVDISDVTTLLNHLAGGCAHENVVTDEAVAATCIKPGLSEGAHCADCGEVLTAQEEIPALGHDFEEKHCTRCGVYDATDDLYFDLVGDTYTVTYYCGYEERICIPATYNGLPVTAIGESAFEEDDDVVYVEIPEGVTEIGNYAFCECYYLREIVLPSTLTFLGDEAFYYCEALESIDLPEGLTEIPYYAFSGCDALKSIVVPEGVTTIGYGAFSYCDDLESVVLPDSVRYIEEYAFDDCYNLWDIKLPENLEGIDYEAFNWCVSLCSIELPENLSYIDDDAFYGCSCLLEVINHSMLDITCGSKDNGEVAYYAKAVHTGESRIVDCDGFLFYSHEGVNYLVDYVGSEPDVVLPQTLNGQPYVLNRYAFAYCDTLRSLVVPEGFTAIPMGAFYSCDNLRTAVLPSTLLSIGDYAFESCSFLMSVNIPENVETLGYESFACCYRLAEIINESELVISYEYNYESYLGNCARWIHTGESGISYIGDYAFLSSFDTNYLLAYFGENHNYLVLPESFNGEKYEISSYFCYDDDYVYTVTIPDTVTGIGEEAFCLCQNLTSVHFGDGIRYIGELAFNITALSEVRLPKNLRSIGRAAFRYCDYLHAVYMPESVEEIMYEAFHDCEELRYVYYGGNVSQWEAMYIGDRNQPLTEASRAYGAEY